MKQFIQRHSWLITLAMLILFTLAGDALPTPTLTALPAHPCPAHSYATARGCVPLPTASPSAYGVP